MNSALASLTATYTDSENEDHFDDQMSDDEDSKESTPEIVIQTSQNNNPKKSFRLVSYNDIQEDEAHSDGEAKTENQELDENVDLEDKYAKYYKKYGFKLPPEPKHSRQNPKLQEMVTNISQKMIKKPEYDLNQYIQEEKKFRNPSIYDKLIQYCALNELGTNFSSDQWDVSIYGPESYYEELAKAQKAEMDKHEKQKKENIKTEVISGKRKSKWDVTSASSDNKLVPNNSSTNSSSSTAKTTTVINAFGTLKKTKV